MRLTACLLPLILAGAAMSAAAAPAEWTAARAPFRIYGNTYYVGSQGLSSILVTSDQGHVLIDAPMAQNHALIEQNIRDLGFRLEDVRLILNSHAHHDHAGGIAVLARHSGAAVRASVASVQALRSGGDDAEDPQHASASLFDPVPDATAFADGETLRLGPLAMTAHLTPGHTPGSTTWTWRSCEAQRCLDLVYADSLSAIAAGSYHYGDPKHPHRVSDFRRGLKKITALPCDILMTPHPDASGLLDRLARRDAGATDALIDSAACRDYASAAAKRLDKRLQDERTSPRG